MEKKTYATHLVAFLASRGMSIAAYVAAVPFFVGRAGEAAYGVVAVGMSFLGIGVVLDSSIAYVVTQSTGRRIARGAPLHPKTINGLLALYLLAACFTSLVALTAIHVSGVHGVQLRLYSAMALALPFLVISAIVGAVAQASNTLVYLNASRVIVEVSKAGALAIAALLPQPLEHVGALVLLGFAVRALVDLYVARTRFGLELRFAGLRTARRFLRMASHGASSIGIVALSLFVLIGDKLLIKQLHTAADVAFYSVAFDVNTKLYVFVHATNSALFTLILRSRANRIRPHRYVRVGLLTVGAIILLVYVPIYLESQRLLALFFTPDFAHNARQLTSLMAVASSIYLLGNVIENSLTAMGRARAVFRAYAIGVLAYFVALPFFDRAFGLAGFVYAYILFMIILAASFVASYLVATTGLSALTELQGREAIHRRG